MMLGYETIIIDDTNFHPSHISDITAIVEAKVPANYSVEILEFDCPVEICIQRDAQREGRAHVGAKVIKQMQKMKDT
jgi:predicted kinase